MSAKAVFGLRFAGSVLSVALAFSLSCLSFFSLGFVLSGLMRTARTAQIVGLTLFFPMVMLSGAAILETMPASIQGLFAFPAPDVCRQVPQRRVVRRDLGGHAGRRSWSLRGSSCWGWP
ncbi:MAG: ABC transporter permease [Comamonadaceae bacterium]|nr:ABC transporter permease [Comamonadaceae bacterium]